MKTFKSSYSNDAEGGECIEATPRYKSSYSNASEGGECIEIASRSEVIRIRDSKRTSASGLPLPEGAWSDFVTYAAAVTA
ncbi:DUF397 domain-containing protein [Streptomyces griseocarneus]|nr:DUF397 domain-containing protein [Streptomyces griseocarneus]